MKQMPVLIQVSDIQEVNGQTETIELFSNGLFSQHEADSNTWSLCYHEHDDEHSCNKTTLTNHNGQIMLSREGDFPLAFIFEEGIRHNGMYHTPYGPVDLGIYSNSVAFVSDDCGGVVTIAYTVNINTDLLSMHKMIISFHYLSR
ncbi:MAG: DUF1934 domain-containing protein [Oscillospiraceae bacterium]|nr:DUF1934 domain-containing protein [Oscillospiraceae bacterium]